jgi:hypothetical protein
VVETIVCFRGLALRVNVHNTPKIPIWMPLNSQTKNNNPKIVYWNQIEMNQHPIYKRRVFTLPLGRCYETKSSHSNKQPSYRRWWVIYIYIYKSSYVLWLNSLAVRPIVSGASATKLNCEPEIECQLAVARVHFLSVRSSFVFVPTWMLIKIKKDFTSQQHLRATLHTRDWEPGTVTLQALSLGEMAEPVQVCYFTLRLRDQRSMWMQDGCGVYVGSYVASNGPCFMVTWTVFKTRLLEVGQHKSGRPWQSECLQTVGLFSFIMCEDLHE